MSADPVVLFVEPGHFYSPIPSPDESEFAIFNRNQNVGRKIPGVNIDMEAMIKLWNELQVSMIAAPFPDERSPDFRYYYLNDFYSYGDALTYYAFLERLRPRQVVEIGSGFSSALLLDTIEHLSLDTTVDFIEPYPSQLYECLRPTDLQKSNLIISKVQGVELSVFSKLNANDILFIDSSHVAKTGSDLCFEVFDILPQLSSGVFVHFHDIFTGFEYPDSWIRPTNRAWNECYFLRAFLMYNDQFDVVFFNSQFATENRNLVATSPALFKQNVGGSLWLRRR